MDKYIGRLLDNRYEILEVIGNGGMAVVYKARCHRLNRLVAIKILKDDFLEDEDFRNRFHAESQAVAMLSHPNIVSVYDVSTSQSGDLDYIVMELIEGITLKQYMEKKGVLNWKETLHFAIQIAKALDHAHSRGVVHRDIKPHNVMVLKNGSVKVADFGIARMMSEGSTLTKEALGSVHYISPEQAKGGRVDNRSDIYSLGVVMYEMMSGRPPYEGETPVSVAIQHINGGAILPSTLNPSIPNGLEQIIMKAMAHDMEQRYASATQMLVDMDEFRKNPEIVFQHHIPDLDGVSKFQKVPLVLETHGGKTAAEKVADRAAKSSQKAAPVAHAAQTPKQRIRQMDKEHGLARKQREEDKRNRAATIAIVVCCVVMAIAMFALVWVVMRDFQPGIQKKVDAPNLKGKYYDQLPEYDGLQIVVGETVYHETYEAGKIIKQDVVAGTKVDAGTVISVTVSRGQRPEGMPDLKGMERTRAEKEMSALKESLGLIIQWEEEYNNVLAAGNVIGTEPTAFEKLEKGQTITITVSKGKNNEPKEVEMPDLLEEQWSDARKKLSDLGFPEPKISWIFSEQPENTVISQSVEAGEMVMNDTEIVIEISKGQQAEESGPASAMVPLLTGKTLEAAKQILTEKGFAEPTVVEVYSSREVGIVVDQSHGTKDGMISTDTVITLEVSKGAAPPPTPAPTPAPTPTPTPENTGADESIDTVE